VDFDQDIELALTGKLIVEISLGDQLQQGKPSAATLYGLVRLLEAWWLILAVGDHVQHD